VTVSESGPSETYATSERSREKTTGKPVNLTYFCAIAIAIYIEIMYLCQIWMHLSIDCCDMKAEMVIPGRCRYRQVSGGRSQLL